MRQDATLRKLEVIGQAVKNLSDHAKSLQPEIPWKQIAGMRQRYPCYFFVNLEIVWGVVQKEPPDVSDRNRRPPERCVTVHADKPRTRLKPHTRARI